MKTSEFNRDFTIDRKTRAGVRANPKHAAPTLPPEIMTADGTLYDPTQEYYFFDEQTNQIRQTIGLRRTDEHLCTFGLRVIGVSKLRSDRDDALSDGQTFFKSQIENLQSRIKSFELEKVQI